MLLYACQISVKNHAVAFTDEVTCVDEQNKAHINTVLSEETEGAKDKVTTICNKTHCELLS